MISRIIKIKDHHSKKAVDSNNTIKHKNNQVQQNHPKLSEKPQPSPKSQLTHSPRPIHCTFLHFFDTTKRVRFEPPNAIIQNHPLSARHCLCNPPRGHKAVAEVTVKLLLLAPFPLPLVRLQVRATPLGGA